MKALNWDLYDKNLPAADKLQEQYGLTETLKDLYAWEILTEKEVVGIQAYKDAHLDDDKSDTLVESMLTDHKALTCYNRGSITLAEALELQKIRGI